MKRQLVLTLLVTLFLVSSVFSAPDIRKANSCEEVNNLYGNLQNFN